MPDKYSFSWFIALLREVAQAEEIDLSKLGPLSAETKVDGLESHDQITLVMGVEKKMIDSFSDRFLMPDAAIQAETIGQLYEALCREIDVKPDFEH